MSDAPCSPDFEDLYRDQRRVDDLPAVTPWDIGRPQPAVVQLAASGAIRGEVLDAGTGPGHHAILFASRGHAVTGVDSSETAIGSAKANAERSGVSVAFEVADATALTGFDDRFDTVVDSALYHVFDGDEPTQKSYLEALHRVARPGARLFMFEFGCHNVNGVIWDGVPAENFQRLLPLCGWQLDGLTTTTYIGHYPPEVVTMMKQVTNPRVVAQAHVMEERLRVIDPYLDDHLVHLPFWAVAATRT